MKKLTIILFLFLLNLFTLASDSYEVHVMDFFPSHYKDENGLVTGREVERIAEAFKAVGRKVSFVLVPINRCIYMLNTGAAKMCGTLAVSKNSRYENVEFNSVPISPNKSRAFFVKLTNLKEEFDLNNLKRTRVGVFDLPEYVEELKRRNAVVDISRSDSFVISKLLNGRLKVGVIHESSFDFLPNYQKNQIEKIGDFIELEGFVGFSKYFNTRRLAMEELDKGLVIIKKNGKMDEIQKKWKKLVEEKSKNNLQKN